MEVFFWLCAGIVIYTYAAYPLLIAALARLHRAEHAIGTAPTRASVVLVVRNEEQRISARIQNLLAQEPRGVTDEVVVVSDGSDDATCEIVERLATNDPRIRLVRMVHPQGKAAGVNAGVAASRSDFVVFADARQDFLPETIARLLSRFSDPSVGAVSGELRFRTRKEQGDVAESVGIYWKYEVWIRRSEASVDSVIGCPGSVYAARRELIQPMPVGTILDDVWVPMHVVMRGKRVAYEGQAVAEDDPSVELKREFSRKVRTLAGNVQLVLAAPRLLSPFHNRLWWMFVSHKVLRLIVPYALVGAFVANLMLNGAIYSTLLIAQCAFYVLGAVGYALGGRKSFCRICGTIKVFLSINAAAMLGVGYALSGKSRTLWQRPTRPGRP